MMEKHNNHDEHQHHIVPLKTYYLTIFALLVLTAITVGASYANFGSTATNLAISMAIACSKASLVMMFFMGLRWDSNLNRISILSTLLALAVFVWLTSSDLWFRIPEKYVAVKKTGVSIGMADIKRFEAENTPEKIAHGKSLFATNCAACHGAEGHGDGPAGAALNPRPRSFTDPVSKWTNGSSKHSIYVTISEGIKNTGMAGFPSLSCEDRWALVHFIRSLVTDKQEIGKVDDRFLKVLETVDGIGAGAVAKESIPVDLAIEIMVDEQKKK